jgi:sec-independent protein translocase protein TatB
MFDIGFSELLVIAVVALIVLGPERLPKAARFAGLWVRKARAQWYSVKSEFEREMAADELRRSLSAQSAELRRDIEDTGREIGASVRAAETQVRAAGPDVAPAPAAPDTVTAAAEPAAAADPDTASPQASLFADPPSPGPRP